MTRTFGDFEKGRTRIDDAREKTNEEAICHVTRRVFGGTNKFPLAGSTFHGDLGKPGDHCQSARPCFQTAQRKKKRLAGRL